MFKIKIDKLFNIHPPKKTFYFIVFLVVILFGFLDLSACSKLKLHTYKVVKVLDGDTIILENGWHVRYLGIDAPETKRRFQGDWIEVNQKFSEEAKMLNEALVLGKKVRLEFDKVVKDRYGRYLAYCYVGKKMVNLELLRKGLAFIFFMAPNDKYAGVFKEWLCEAYRGKKGLWASPETIITPEQMRYYNYYVKAVVGKVRRVIMAGSRTYIYMNCSTDLVSRIVIPYVYFSSFSTQRYATWVGKKIFCIGKVRCKKKLCEIKVFHPIQISVFPYCSSDSCSD